MNKLYGLKVITSTLQIYCNESNSMTYRFNCKMKSDEFKILRRLSHLYIKSTCNPILITFKFLTLNLISHQSKFGLD